MNRKHTILILVLVICYAGLFAQKPLANGTYTFKVEFNEWEGKSMGATCMVKIKNDSVWIIHNGSKGIDGKKGEIIDRGILVKHRSGKWIIATTKSDKDASEIGGCTDGPRILDFKRRLVSFC